MTLSLQNIHLLKEDEDCIEHAARRGGRRPSRLSTGSRWALGAGAATAGILIGRNRRVRKAVGKVARRVAKSKAWRRVAKSGLVKKARKTINAGVKRVRGSSAYAFAANRVGGLKRIGAAGKGAVGRVYGRVKSRVASGLRRAKRTAMGYKRAAPGTRKRIGVTRRYARTRRR